MVLNAVLETRTHQMLRLELIMLEVNALFLNAGRWPQVDFNLAVIRTIPSKLQVALD